MQSASLEREEVPKRARGFAKVKFVARFAKSMNKVGKAAK
jgi:hypothetical protein